jgi:hypothetical protein
MTGAGCYCQLSGELRRPFGNCYVAQFVAHPIRKSPD